MARLKKYIIERDIPNVGSLSEEEICRVSAKSLESLQRLGPQIQWIHSFVTDDKVYCIYLAPDEETIRQHGELTGLPVDRISAVQQLLDPDRFSSSSA
jgi:hypothetical protein